MNAVLSALTLALMTTGAMHAVENTSVLAEDYQEQIKKFAKESYETVFALSEGKYKEITKKAEARGSAFREPQLRYSFTTTALGELLPEYLEHVIDLSAPIAKNLYKEEAVIFWTEIEKEITKTIGTWDYCHRERDEVNTIYRNRLVKHASCLIKYQMALHPI